MTEMDHAGAVATSLYKRGRITLVFGSITMVQAKCRLDHHRNFIRRMQAKQEQGWDFQRSPEESPAAPSCIMCASLGLEVAHTWGECFSTMSSMACSTDRSTGQVGAAAYYEIWKHCLSTQRVHVKVLQNLIVQHQLSPAWLSPQCSGRPHQQLLGVAA